MRLIDADRLKEELERYRFAVVGFEGVLAVIDNAPTVQPKIGHWEILPPCFEEICCCSVCNKGFKEALQHTKSCPNCGAIMTGCE